ncbi:molybdenum cofactor guanylyltransferase [filamentous cyanobacterium CCP2]|nr:molybdenum cofactor guanylyltransferase [filamentous cyanobacterium CCP2]
MASSHRILSNESELTLNAIVLAGGQSSRMGQDKAFVQVDHMPMLLHVCTVARQCTDTVYVVTPWVERYQNLVGDLVQFIPEQTSSDEFLAQHGPLVGFAQGLAHVQSEWVLLLACDLPYLQAEVLQEWMTFLPEVDETTVALLPRHPQGWWEALCGFYRRRCLESLEAFIPEGGRSFQRWLSHQPIQEIPLFDPQMLFNCNTPNDIKKAEEQLAN